MTTDALEHAAVLSELRLRCHQAKRDMPKIGDEDHPTPWDLDHRRIDELLTRLEREDVTTLANVHPALLPPRVTR